MFFLESINARFMKYLSFANHGDKSMCCAKQRHQWYEFAVEIVQTWYKGTYHTRTGARWCDIGDILFFIESELHNTYGPARITAAGDQIWFYHDEIHRVDGPAVITRDGNNVREEWYSYGKHHRVKGPAVIVRDVSGAIIASEFWFRGVRCSPELYDYFLIFE